jgi:hypothetical protein
VEDSSLQEETDEFLTAAGNPRTETRIATANEAWRTMQIVDACYKKLPTVDAAATLART